MWYENGKHLEIYSWFMWCVNGKHLELYSRDYVVCEWKALRNRQQGLCGV